MAKAESIESLNRQLFSLRSPSSQPKYLNRQRTPLGQIGCRKLPITRAEHGNIAALSNLSFPHYSLPIPSDNRDLFHELFECERCSQQINVCLERAVLLLRLFFGALHLRYLNHV